MSLDAYKMPSLRDKIREQAEKEVEVKEVKKEKVEVKVTKGRRLNK